MMNTERETHIDRERGARRGHEREGKIKGRRRESRETEGDPNSQHATRRGSMSHPATRCSIYINKIQVRERKVGREGRREVGGGRREERRRERDMMWKTKEKERDK